MLYNPFYSLWLALPTPGGLGTPGDRWCYARAPHRAGWGSPAAFRGSSLCEILCNEGPVFLNHDKQHEAWGSVQWAESEAGFWLEACSALTERLVMDWN